MVLSNTMYDNISTTAPKTYLGFGDWYVNDFVPQHVQFYGKRGIVSYGNFPGTEKLFQHDSTCGTRFTYFYAKRCIVLIGWAYRNVDRKHAREVIVCLNQKNKAKHNNCTIAHVITEKQLTNLENEGLKVIHVRRPHWNTQDKTDKDRGLFWTIVRGR